MMIYSPGGTGDRTFLERKDVSFMNEYWPDRATLEHQNIIHNGTIILYT